MGLGVGVLATLVSSGCINVGKALQKKGIQTLPRLAYYDTKVLREYIQHRTWLTGILLGTLASLVLQFTRTLTLSSRITGADLGGGLLSIVALSHAPVSVVQPISSAGLSVLAVFSHVYLNERLSRREWAAVALAVAGTVGVAATAPPSSEGDAVPLSFPGLLVLLLLLGLAGSAARSSLRKARGVRRGSVPGVGTLTRTASGAAPAGQHALSAAARAEELSYGALAGAAYALSASCCRAGLLGHEHARSAAVRLPILIAGLLASAGLTAAGVVAQTRGLKDGSAMVISTVAAVVAMVVGLLAGLLCLGEHAPSTARGMLIWACSWAAIAVGVSGLSQAGSGGPHQGLGPSSSASTVVDVSAGTGTGIPGSKGLLVVGAPTLWGTFTRASAVTNQGGHLLPMFSSASKSKPADEAL